MKAILLPAALCAALTGWADPAPAQDAASVARRLVVRSGLSVQLRSVPRGVEQQMAQLKGQLPDTVIATLEQAGREAFRPESLQEEIERLLAGKLKVPEMEKALAWLESDAGRRITLAEELSSATTDDAALKRYAEQQKANPVPERRRKLVAELIAATGTVESTASLIEATSLGVAIGMDSMQPVQKRAGVARLRAEIEKQMPRKKVMAMLEASLPAIFGYTYRDVSHADLSKYLAFLRSADGRKYNAAMVEAFTQAAVAASVRMGQLVEQAGTKRPA